jgi:DNA-binding response OmpR family regulator
VPHPLGARILVLDDDSVARRLLETSLTGEGFVVHTFGTMAHARAAVAREPYDLYLLDIVLPDGNGLDMCELIRQRSLNPIIMLTVKGDLSDVVKGLEAGADDYVSKPFRMQEVAARVRAQLRRAQREDGARETAVRVGELIVDRDLRDAVLDGKPLRLSPREFEILDFLAARGGRSASRESIIESIWGEEEDLSEKILAVYVRRLRVKIEKDPEQPRYLHTVRGFGYRLAIADDVT